MISEDIYDLEAYDLIIGLMNTQSAFPSRLETGYNILGNVLLYLNFGKDYRVGMRTVAEWWADPSEAGHIYKTDPSEHRPCEHMWALARASEILGVDLFPGDDYLGAECQICKTSASLNDYECVAFGNRIPV